MSDCIVDGLKNVLDGYDLHPDDSISLHRAIAALEAQQWRSVEDELPNSSNQYVQMYTPKGTTFQMVSNFEHPLSDHATHWMPLPTPPEAKLWSEFSVAMTAEIKERGLKLIWIAEHLHYSYPKTSDVKRGVMAPSLKFVNAWVKLIDCNAKEIRKWHRMGAAAQGWKI